MSQPSFARSERPDISSLLARLRPFEELSPSQIGRIAPQTSVRRLPKGDMLFRQGESAQGFYVVASGQIKLAFASAQGSEKVVEIIGPGQSFGEAVMFMGRP